jgi:hypothetical protein
MTPLGPPPFRDVNSSHDLDELSREHDKVLLVGIFDWSNYSHQVMREIALESGSFAEANCGLGVFRLDHEEEVQSLCPDFCPVYRQAVTEPALILLCRGQFIKCRFGRVPVQEILLWIVADDCIGLSQKP